MSSTRFGIIALRLLMYFERFYRLVVVGFLRYLRYEFGVCYPAVFVYYHYCPCEQTCERTVFHRYAVIFGEAVIAEIGCRNHIVYAVRRAEPFVSERKVARHGDYHRVGSDAARALNCAPTSRTLSCRGSEICSGLLVCP